MTTPDNAVMDTLRTALRELIERRYSQSEIAAAAGVTQSTISRLVAGSGIDYEAGKRIELFFEQEKARDFRRTPIEAAA